MKLYTVDTIEFSIENLTQSQIIAQFDAIDWQDALEYAACYDYEIIDQQTGVTL